MVDEVAPVRGVEEEHVCPVAGREPANVVGADDVRRIDRAGAKGFGWREPEPGARQVHN